MVCYAWKYFFHDSCLYYLSSLAGLFKSIKDPRDGILQAASVALGFALGENFLYAFDSGMLELLYRSFFGTLGHMTFSLIWGFTWAAFVCIPDRENRTPALLYVVPSLILSIIFHGVYNAFPAYDYPWFALVTAMVTLLLFFTVYSYVKDNSPYKKYLLNKYRSAVLTLQTGVRKYSVGRGVE